MAQTAEDWLEANRKSWNVRAAAHAQDASYNVAAFQADPSYLSEVIRFDLPRLPSLQDQRVAHLMCHIGTDTLSLARLGAHHVVGLDFSAAAIVEARKLAQATAGAGGERCTYVEGNVYDAATLLAPGTYDVVFTSVGVLGWLPRVREWAQSAAALLRPGGTFFMREIHPALFAVDESITDENPAQQLRLAYPYFEQPAGLVVEDYDYADVAALHGTSKDVASAKPTLHRTHQFSHGLAEIVQALIEAGLTIQLLLEHDSVPFLGLPRRMEHTHLQEYQLHAPLSARLPLSFTIRAVKREGEDGR